MEKDTRPGLPPQPGRFAPFSPPSSSSSSSSFIHDLSRMPDTPPKSTGHRRAHSEILTLPDDISFDSDLGVVETETEEDLFSMYIDMDKVNAGGPGDRPRARHQHSQSMDGFGSGSGSGSGGDETGNAKKAMSAAKLAELALIDPKRAKRIWANRQSAARSKERKMRYIAELERKVQTLQTEATSLSAQLTLLQRDTNGLSSENGELKVRLQTMEQQVHLQDALNEALREEVQHLKMLTGQALSNGGSMMNFPTSFAGNQPFYTNKQAIQSMLTAQQLQQLQIHSQNPQFQRHQLHQLQHQQDPGSAQHPSDFKMRTSMPLSKENISDPNSNSGGSKD